MSTRLESAQAHIQNKQYPQALAEAQKLVRTGQHLAQAHNIIGIAAKHLGNLTLSQTAFEKVAHLAPNDSRAWSNLGQAAYAAHNYPLMLTAFSKVWQLKPELAEAGCMVATAQVNQGHIQQALQTINKVRQQTPGYPKAEAFHLSLQTDILPMEQWHTLWNNLPAHLWPLEHNCMVAQLKMVWSWAYAQADFQTYLRQLHQLVTKAQSSGLEKHINVINAEAYGNMFQQLAAHGLPPAINPALPPLYMVGDSHSLPPHGQTVSWNNQPHQLHARLVVGLKLWQMAQPQISPARASFLAQIDTLPPDAIVIVSVGEIDARPAYGIYKHAQKYSKPWAPLIAATVGPALAWLKQQQQGRTFIIPGIPAPLDPLKLSHAGQGNADDFIACATSINAALKEAALKHGFPFINIFDYTTENPSSFAEPYHLTPTALPQALQSHLILPN